MAHNCKISTAMHKGRLPQASEAVGPPFVFLPRHVGAGFMPAFNFKWKIFH